MGRREMEHEKGTLERAPVVFRRLSFSRVHKALSICGPLSRPTPLTRLIIVVIFAPIGQLASRQHAARVNQLAAWGCGCSLAGGLALHRSHRAGQTIQSSTWCLNCVSGHRRSQEQDLKHALDKRHNENKATGCRPCLHVSFKIDLRQSPMICTGMMSNADCLTDLWLS